jgi:glycosyltransferase involved in cell wall biosynthesis
MRIAYVIPYFAPAWGYGGPPRLAYDMARQLTRRGHAVHVLTSDALDQHTRARPLHEVLDGVPVTRVPNVSNGLAWNYKVFLPTGFGQAFAKALQTTQLVHIFDFRDYQNAVALPRLRRAGVPYVLSALGELPRAHGIKRWIKVVYDVVWGRRLVRHAAALLAQTPEEASWYERLGARRERIRLIPLAVDAAALRARSAQASAEFRRSLGIGPTDKIVLFLGRIHAYKGLDVLIRAFARATEARADVRLVIAGRDDGFLDDARRIARAAPGKVLFSGPIYGAARFDAYRAADLFALTPSHAEQTSLASLEACACGTPVLLSEQAPIPGLAAAGAGLEVPCSVDAVQRALRELLGADLVAMGQRSRRLVQEQFSWSAVTGLVEATYAEAIVSDDPR